MAQQLGPVASVLLKIPGMTALARRAATSYQAAVGNELRKYGTFWGGGAATVLGHGGGVAAGACRPWVPASSSVVAPWLSARLWFLCLPPLRFSVTRICRCATIVRCMA